ncbi:MAG: hypothetical protein DRP29_08175 [Thermodesulfobacteriota bacterium]|nr:MAG: hypothetical protein DRP29_08175 [Thermodesulfobacteriota bacterium]
MQRNLIKYINNIISNKDTNFSKLLKELFNIDGILGQAIVVTHSPNILLNDYKQIVRFYLSEENSIEVKSGVTIKLDLQEEKHLLMNLPYIKEAFFSKCVIIVEGETELGALPIWGEKIFGDMDEYGIGIIKAGGKESIKPLAKLLNSFGIRTVTIKDKDDGKDLDGYDFITDGKDFEEEIVEKLLSENKKLLFELIKELDDKSLERSIRKKKLKEIADKYGITKNWDDKDYKFSEIANLSNQNLIRTMFLAWLNINKSIILGQFIGKKVETKYIPEPYCNAIIMAMELSENG